MRTTTSAACCAVAQAWAESAEKRVMWQMKDRDCTVFDQVWHMSRSHSNTTIGHGGPPPPPLHPLKPTDLYDLYYDSCLNGEIMHDPRFWALCARMIPIFIYLNLSGWTMGNIAVAPLDIARFYHALFTGGLIAQDSVDQMTRYQPRTSTFNP